MNWTKYDTMILMSMGIVVIFMSFTFPALGLTGENVNTTDIPEFNMSKNAVQFIDEFPESPGIPSQGQLTYYANRSGGGDKDQAWLTGTTQDGVEHLILNRGDNTNPDMELRQNYWTDGNVVIDNYTYDNEGDSWTMINNSWVVDYNVTNYENTGQSNFTNTVEWEVRQTPQDTAWWNGIPFVGGAISGAYQLAGVALYLGAIFYWAIATFFQVVINLLLIVINVFVFLISFMHFIITTYFAITSGVVGFGKLIIYIPGVLLSIEFAKIGMLAISLLPTT